MAPGPHAGNRNRPAYSGQPRFRFPKQIIQLFAPRPPLDFKPPPRKRKLRPLTGLSGFISKFENPSNDPDEKSLQSTDVPESKLSDGDVSKLTEALYETPAQRRVRVKREREQHVAQIVAEARKAWDPFKSATEGEKTKEPYNTLFVYNIAPTTLELRLQEEFEPFGPVRNVIMPKDRDGVPRGYAFVEFEHERDAEIAIKRAADMRCDGRRLRIDVERGRTVKGWYPNRLDGPFNSCAPKTIRRRGRRETAT